MLREEAARMFCFSIDEFGDVEERINDGLDAALRARARLVTHARCRRLRT